jgi:hypothetical protein
MRYLGQLFSSQRNNCSQTYAALCWLAALGATADSPEPSSCHLGIACPAVRLVGCVDLFVPPCASLSAYRGAAVSFQLLDVLVAAAQMVPRLVGGFCCAASFNAQDAERDAGTAIERCAHCWAGREIARQRAMMIASRAAGHKPQYWAKAPNGEVVHDATSTVDPAPDRPAETIVSASPPPGTSSSLLDSFAPPLAPRPLIDQTTGAGPPRRRLLFSLGLRVAERPA